MGYSYDRRSKRAFDRGNIKMIVQGMINARDAGYADESLIHDGQELNKSIDITCQRLQRLKRGPANFVQEFNSIAGGLYTVAARYGALARPD